MTDTPSNYGYATGGRALRMCLRCGCLVGDTDVHDAFHDKQDGVEQLSVTTATNLMATLNAIPVVYGMGRDDEAAALPMRQFDMAALIEEAGQ